MQFYFWFHSCCWWAESSGWGVNVMYWNQSIGLVSTVFAYGPGDQDSIPGRVIPKTQKMVLDAALLNTRHHKVCIKGKVEQSREWSGILPYTLVLKLLKRECSGDPRLRLPTLLQHHSKWFRNPVMLLHRLFDKNLRKDMWTFLSPLALG